MQIFVTAIGTDSGKTFVSYLLAEALGSKYWKPVQAGFPTDSENIKSKLGAGRVLPEKWVLNTPASPHKAARIDRVELRVDDIQIPNEVDLLIEGAGGCLVPLNNEEFVIDIALKNNLPVVLVANLYLGSINHTLLTIEFLKQKKTKVLGIIFNGEAEADSQSIIARHSPWPIICHIPQLKDISSETTKPYVQELRNFFTKQG
jgi:dethiobiotin synthetase